MLDTFTWYKQSTFRWKGEKLVVYIDSWGLTDGLPPADLLLITHAHGDHYAPDDIARVQAKKTVIVAPADVAKGLSGTAKRGRRADRWTSAAGRMKRVQAHKANPRGRKAARNGTNGVDSSCKLAGNPIRHA